MKLNNVRLFYANDDDNVLFQFYFTRASVWNKSILFQFYFSFISCSHKPLTHRSSHVVDVTETAFAVDEKSIHRFIQCLSLLSVRSKATDSSLRRLPAFEIIANTVPVYGCGARQRSRAVPGCTPPPRSTVPWPVGIAAAAAATEQQRLQNHTCKLVLKSVFFQ